MFQIFASYFFFFLENKEYTSSKIEEASFEHPVHEFFT